jgi:hypothetical protein
MSHLTTTDQLRKELLEEKKRLQDELKDLDIDDQQLQDLSGDDSEQDEYLETNNLSEKIIEAEQDESELDPVFKPGDEPDPSGEERVTEYGYDEEEDDDDEIDQLLARFMTSKQQKENEAEEKRERKSMTTRNKTPPEEEYEEEYEDEEELSNGVDKEEIKEQVTDILKSFKENMNDELVDIRLLKRRNDITDQDIDELVDMHNELKERSTKRIEHLVAGLDENDDLPDRFYNKINKTFDDIFKKVNKYVV